jgi:hypothetical protein
MERFIHNENLKLWRRQLSETTDPKKRSLLLDLIAKEEAREDEINARAKAAKSQNRDISHPNADLSKPPP